MDFSNLIGLKSNFRWFEWLNCLVPKWCNLIFGSIFRFTHINENHSGLYKERPFHGRSSGFSREMSLSLEWQSQCVFWFELPTPFVDGTIIFFCFLLSLSILLLIFFFVIPHGFSLLNHNHNPKRQNQLNGNENTHTHTTPALKKCAFHVWHNMFSLRFYLPREQVLRTLVIHIRKFFTF